MAVFISTSCFLCGVGQDPVNEVGNFSVDTWVVGSGTSVSPRYNTSKVAGPSIFTDEWSTRISLARVFASFGKTSTDHGVFNFTCTIGITAFFIRDNWDGDLHEDTWGMSTLRCGAPSRYNTISRSSMASFSNRDWCDKVIHCQGGRQLEDRDVIRDSECIVVLVLDDLG